MKDTLLAFLDQAAYWKYAVWRRLTGSKRGSFALEGSNWFPRPEERSAAWQSWYK